MTIFEVVTGYCGNGTVANPYRPELIDKYVVSEWVDVTGLTVAQIKAGDATTAIVVSCDESIYTEINLDVMFSVVVAPEDIISE